MKFLLRARVVVIFLLSISFECIAQHQGIRWTPDGKGYFKMEKEELVQYTLPANTRKVIADIGKMSSGGQSPLLQLKSFAVSADENKVLLYTNAKRVWRYPTRGDYWIFNRQSNSFRQVGKSRPASSLMFAKLSPDGNKVAYVSDRNIYVEDLTTNITKQLTNTNGNTKLINGTFDWVYEEEFYCRDGFRWSPDSKNIAFWQIDASLTRDYLMLNTTDSIYSYVVPVEYPKVGQPPSRYRIGVISLAGASIRWMNIPGDPSQTYLPRMEWAAGSNELIVQQLNRKQNESRLMLCQVSNGAVSLIYQESDPAFIEVKGAWQDGNVTGWDWLENGRSFLWVTEKDGWRHMYKVSRDGKNETLLTRGNYDVIQVCRVDEQAGYIYFLASPDNATQKYLYRVNLSGNGEAEKVSPLNQPGTHEYDISPAGGFGLHTFSNAYTAPAEDWVSLPSHVPLAISKPIGAANTPPSGRLTFFKVRTADNVEMDGWMIKPMPFDSTKKYPVLFYVYGEPAAQTVLDSYGSAGFSLYNGDMGSDGYIQISLDNRGTPAPKGREWRKSIYRQIGRLNIRDQAMACKEILKWKFVDSLRIGVWGWSGGGSSTLHLLFQYPDLYKTGVAVAAVSNQLCYDNIYQERYMGLPSENREDFVNGSPITYAKNLKGNLLYIHGTGDDNVHYQNAELLINELVKQNKKFQLMVYPNRSHGLSEGQGTTKHLSTMFTDFIRTYLPGGGK